MIIGLGCDIVNIERLQKTADFLQKFKAKILGPKEAVEFKRYEQADMREQASRLAKRFAAKEAFVKALGSGFRDSIFLNEIEVLHDELGKPFLEISGTAKERLDKLVANPQILVSVSDDWPYAEAVVIIEGAVRLIGNY